MTHSRRNLILQIVLTDRTFVRTEISGTMVWVGKCIHCNSNLTIDGQGNPLSDATIEHIIPRTGGGTDALDNLALACARCNHQKGYRHDFQPNSSRSLEVTANLQQRRRKRWRELPA